MGKSNRHKFTEDFPKVKQPKKKLVYSYPSDAEPVYRIGHSIQCDDDNSDLSNYYNNR